MFDMFRKYFKDMSISWNISGYILKINYLVYPTKVIFDILQAVAFFTDGIT